MKKFFYATNNPGKIFEVSKHLNTKGIKVISPKDLNIHLDVSETGSTLEENAKLKALAYIKLVKKMPIIADDTGIEIDALRGEPGIHVRRWKDGKTSMTDQEIINYCLELMKNIPKEDRTARFRTVIAIAFPGHEPMLVEGALKGVILESASKEKMEGFPFESLFFIPEYKMALWQLHRLDGKRKEKYLTHREKAIQNALPEILQVVKQS